MKVEKLFKMENKDPEKFDKEVIDYLVKHYDCDEDMAKMKLQDCLAYGWSILINLSQEVIGIQTNYDRSEIKVGR